MTDPVADMLTRIRNAYEANHNTTVIPHSKLKEAVAKLMHEEGYLDRYEVIREGKFPTLRVHLKYVGDREPMIRGMNRISKPGCRIYTNREDIPWVKYGLGTVVLSTPRGVVTGKDARRMGVGGEILCEIW
jgi:small subunit ribosomal protein S8